MNADRDNSLPSRYAKILFFFASVLILLPVFWIFPSGDDWSTATPFITWTIADFRPSALWRPIEILFRCLLGYTPALFPLANHAATLSGHAISAWLTFKLLSQTKLAPIHVAVAATIALLAPGTNAAAWSVDGLIQTWSTASGLFATYILTGRSRHRHLTWLIPVFIGTLWKESGIGWFVAAPLLAQIFTSHNTGEAKLDNKTLRRLIGLGSLGIVAYFAIRIPITVDTNGLGAESGRYSLVVNPISMVKNFVMLVGSASTSGSTLAALGQPRNIPLLLVTALAGLPLLLSLVIHLKSYSHKLLQVAIIVGFVAGPHLLLPHVSEMYSHPLVFVLILIGTPPLVLNNRRRLLLGGFVIAFVVGSLVTGAHKFSAIHESGRVSKRVAAQIASSWNEGTPPKSLCVIQPVDRDAPLYSVFQMTPYMATLRGRAALYFWGFDAPTKFINSTSIADCEPQSPSGFVLFSPKGAITTVDGIEF